MGKNNIYSDHEMLDLYKKKTLQLGRLPLYKEINADDNMPSYTTYWRRFGNKNEIYDRLDISMTLIKKISILCEDCIYEPSYCDKNPLECLKEADLFFSNIDL